MGGKEVARDGAGGYRGWGMADYLNWGLIVVGVGAVGTLLGVFLNSRSQRHKVCLGSCGEKKRIHALAYDYSPTHRHLMLLVDLWNASLVSNAVLDVILEGRRDSWQRDDFSRIQAPGGYQGREELRFPLNLEPGAAKNGIVWFPLPSLDEWKYLHLVAPVSIGRKLRKRVVVQPVSRPQKE